MVLRGDDGCPEGGGAVACAAGAGGRFRIYNPPGGAEDFHAAWVRFQAGVGHPVVWSPYNGGHWIAVRGQDVLDIHADHAQFSSRRNVLPATVKPALGGALMLDPPAHAPYRHVLNTGLSPKIVRQEWSR